MTITATLIAAALMGSNLSAAAVEPASGRAALVGSAQIEAPKARDVKYCIKDTLTGSRVAKKICKARDEWIAQGISPDKL